MGLIIGGEGAVPHSWPWQCSLQDDREHICGCSVISHEWVITAAHCKFIEWPELPGIYDELPTSKLSVVVGAHRINKNETSQKRHYIRQAIVHERYRPWMYDNFDNFDNDIMLLRLKSRIQFNRYVKPICVDASVFPSNTLCSVTGWGTVHPKVHKYPDELQEVEVRTIPNEICSQSDWYGLLPRYKPSMMICAGYAEGGKDSCSGDSGGPLMCRAPNGRWKLIGLVSWGEGCAVAKKPGLYTRVEHYVDWIKQYVHDLPPSTPYRSGGNTRSNPGKRT